MPGTCNSVGYLAGVNSLQAIEGKLMCRESIKERFGLMRDELNATGHQIVYSIDDWGTTNPYTYGMEVCSQASSMMSWELTLRLQA
jgi:hypothetical protein